jgi:hypothetical protein
MQKLVETMPKHDEEVECTDIIMETMAKIIKEFKEKYNVCMD